MSCTPVRLDNVDYNESFTQYCSQVVEVSGFIYLVYANVDTTNGAAGNRNHNREITFVKFNVATKTVTTRKIISTIVGTASTNDGVSMVRLTSGVLVVTSGESALGVRSWESLDEGVNWTGPTTVDAAPTRFGVGMITDGVSVHSFIQDRSGGGGGANLYLYKRTGAGTWGASATVFTGTMNVAPIVQLGEQTRLSSMRIGGMQSNSVAFIIMDYTNTYPNIDQVRCFWTTDSWSTVNNVLIEDYSSTDVAGAVVRNPQVFVGTDNRCRATWTRSSPTLGNIPVLAYTDDWGQHWTVIGTPTILDNCSVWDATFDTGMALSSTNGWFLTALDDSDGSNVKLRRYDGGDTLSGWSETIVCSNLGLTYAGGTIGETFVSAGSIYRVFNKGNSGGPFPFWSIEILYDTLPPGGGGGTELIEESPSGTDQPNMYLRLDIADDRGWSAHQVGVTCFTHWPEGDYTTERRKPEILGSVSSIDANIQDVAILPAYWKMDDPERWGKEALVKNADATYTYIDDPFLFKWWSTNLSVGESGSQNIFRGVYLKYRRPSQETFDVQVWIDGAIADVQTIPAGLGPQDDPAEFWWPIPRSTNVGSLIQLRIEDRERIDLKVEEFSIKFRPKHWRMRG